MLKMTKTYPLILFNRIVQGSSWGCILLSELTHSLLRNEGEINFTRAREQTVLEFFNFACHTRGQTKKIFDVVIHASLFYKSLKKVYELSSL